MSAPAPRNDHGFPSEPTLYPILLHNVANLIEALTAFDKADPNGHESPHFVAAGELAIYNEEQQAEDPRADADPMAGLVGWVVFEDAATWVFRPHFRSDDRPTEASR